MEKKHLPLRIVHSVLLIAALVFCIVALIKNPTDTTVYGGNPIVIVCDLLNIVTLAFGAVYIAMGYEKRAAIFYKMFMAALTVAAVFQVALLMTNVILPFSLALLYLVALVMTTILAVSQDLGKTDTYIVVTVLVLCRCVLLISMLSSLSFFGTSVIGVLSASIASLLTAITAGLAVCGKYLDKAERGAK